LSKQKPETEIQLSDLQTTYLQTRDPKIWHQMFNIMINYARSLTLKVNKGKVFISPEHITEVAIDASIKIMERYKDPTFKIDFSFAGLLRWKVLESLYKDWQEEYCLSLNHIVREDCGTELGDLELKNSTPIGSKDQSCTPEKLDEALDFQNVTRDIGRVFEEFDTVMNDSHISLLARLYTLLMFRRSKVRRAMEAFRKHIPLTLKEEKALDLLLLEIKNRLHL
jgi:hypothetical protein